MWKKILEKLAYELIKDSYLDGHNDGYKLGYEQHKRDMRLKNKGQFKKGNIPWNKGKKKGK